MRRPCMMAAYEPSYTSSARKFNLPRNIAVFQMKLFFRKLDNVIHLKFRKYY